MKCRAFALDYRRSVLTVGLLAALVYALAVAQSATAACYYTGGGCGFGSLAANTATPLTGIYSSGLNYAEDQAAVDFSKGLRIRRNGNYSNWFYGSSYIHTMYYSTGPTQHQCKNAAATPQPMRCGFL